MYCVRAQIHPLFVHSRWVLKLRYGTRSDAFFQVLGLYLLVAVFAILAYFSVSMIIENRNNRALEAASAISED